MKIKIFSTPNCPYCIKAKEYLKEKGLEFEEIDISKDQDAAQDIIKRSKQMSVPVIEIDGELVIGFDKEKIDELLENKKW